MQWERDPSVCQNQELLKRIAWHSWMIQAIVRNEIRVAPV